jgi:hypothetical protein
MTRKIPRVLNPNLKGSTKLRKKLKRLLEDSDIRIKLKRIYNKDLAGSSDSEQIHGFKGDYERVNGYGDIMDRRPKGVKSGYYPHVKSPNNRIYAWTPVLIGDSPTNYVWKDPNLDPKYIPRYLIAFKFSRNGSEKIAIDLDRIILRKRLKNER